MERISFLLVLSFSLTYLGAPGEQQSHHIGVAPRTPQGEGRVPVAVCRPVHVHAFAGLHTANDRGQLVLPATGPEMCSFSFSDTGEKNVSVNFRDKNTEERCCV